MAYEFHYTPTGTGAISGAEVLEQTEDAINDLGNTAISGVQEALDKAEQAFTNSANAVDDAQTALNTANNAEGVAIQAQNDVSNLSGTVTNIGNRVTTAEGNIGNLQGRMTTAEGNIGNLQGRMTTAEGNIGNLQTAVSTAQATANSAQQTATTARQQSYVFRYSSTTLVASSTNSNSLLDNTDNLKVGDKVIDASGVIYSITAIDTANSTFTIGTSLIDLAQDSDVVHKSGDETVGGSKIFSHTQTGVGRDLYHFTSSPYSKNTPPANISYQYIWFIGNSASQGLTNNWYSSYIEQVMTTEGSARSRWLIRDTSESAIGIELFVNGNDKQFRPQGNNITDLGTSTNKWKSFNGVEPSSLSLPSGNASDVIDISSYLVNLDGTVNTYTAPANGWISIAVVGTAIAIISSSWSDNRSKLSDGTVRMLYPVLKGMKANISVVCTTLVYARFIPCQGNV